MTEDNKLEKITNKLKLADKKLAKWLDWPRIYTVKTEDMPKMKLNDYANDCEKFIEWAKAARTIEHAAKDGKLNKIASYARSCKMDIKSCFEKFIKGMSRGSKNYTLESGQLDKATGKFKKLLSQLNKPLGEMMEIYNTAVASYIALTNDRDITPIKADPKPSAPPLPDNYYR